MELALRYTGYEANESGSGPQTPSEVLHDPNSRVTGSQITLPAGDYLISMAGNFYLGGGAQLMVGGPNQPAPILQLEGTAGYQTASGFYCLSLGSETVFSLEINSWGGYAYCNYLDLIVTAI